MQQDHRTRDVGSIVLRLRGDLVFTPRRVRGEASYVVEDQINSKYYSIGLPEYTFLSCLDGKTSVDEALSLNAKSIPREALTEQDAAAVCRWLVESELAHTAESQRTDRLAKNTTKASHGKGHAWNPLYTKVPLFYPDRFLGQIAPWTQWLFSPAAVVIASVMAMLATYRVLDQWDRFMAASSGVLSPGRWLWLALCWLGLKIVHELSHGIVCKKYGGTVRESGAIFILLAPLAYVDVTSSWRFRSKWPRIFTATAGMYIEIIIAAIAALAWCSTQPGMLNDVCFNLVLMASVSTLLFNANPLMRFDGYYILADLVDIPNLYSDGQLFLRNLGRRYVFGVDARLSTGSRSRDLFIWLYAVAAFCWRQFVTFGLILIAATMFEGAGVVIAIAATIAWLAVPTAGTLKYLIRGTSWEQPSKLRFALVVVPISCLLITAANVLPWPGVTRAPAIVEYAPLSVVRSGCRGFVQSVHVRAGEIVAAGQLIAELENRELSSELRDLELAMEQARLRARTFQKQEELAAYQAELKELESLGTKYNEKRQEARHLTIVAPHGGRVVGRDPGLLLGTYLPIGTELVAIGDERRKELLVSVRQEDVNVFKAHLGASICLRLSGGRRLACNLTKLPPQASTTPPHPSLCAPYGGPLEVRARPGIDKRDDVYELIKPRFEASVSLPVAESQTLRAGQRGVVWLSRGNVSIADYLLRRLYKAIPRELPM